MPITELIWLNSTTPQYSGVLLPLCSNRLPQKYTSTRECGLQRGGSTTFLCMSGWRKSGHCSVFRQSGDDQSASLKVILIHWSRSSIIPLLSQSFLFLPVSTLLCYCLVRDYRADGWWNQHILFLPLSATPSFGFCPPDYYSLITPSLRLSSFSPIFYSFVPPFRPSVLPSFVSFAPSTLSSFLSFFLLLSSLVRAVPNGHEETCLHAYINTNDVNLMQRKILWDALSKIWQWTWY